MVGSFAHQEPVWFYAAMLPVMILPWVLWPTFLGSLRHVAAAWRGAGERDSGFRLAAVWAIAALFFMTAISGKRPHYLLPMFPALAMMAAVLITAAGRTPGRWEMVLPALPVAVLATAILILPWAAGSFGIPEWSDVAWPWGIAALAAAGWLVLRPPAATLPRAGAIAAAAAVAVAALHGAVAPRLFAAYDLVPVARSVRSAQADGYTVANYGKYHGQFNFLGRLTEPLDEIDDATLEEWLAARPRAKVVAYHKRMPDAVGAELVRPFRGRWIAVWDASALRADPMLAHPSVP
jgi:4-amino-4-deoxy-L-arabinose transferase-like glycosyltransferase